MNINIPFIPISVSYLDTPKRLGRREKMMVRGGGLDTVFDINKPGLLRTFVYKNLYTTFQVIILIK
jgi:hypothetical protein